MANAFATPAAARPARDLWPEVNAISGWLHEVTARRTIDLLGWQEARGVSGPLLEIGVFCGKYFSILLDSALRRGDHVVGADTFEFVPAARVHDELAKVHGSGARRAYTLIEGPSSVLSAEALLRAYGPFRFVSVDGAHDAENVFLDLCLSEAVIGDQGVIAVDDFLNPLTLGVNVAVNRFLSRPRRVVPIAYVSNKLFLVHRSVEALYHAAMEGMIRDGVEPQSEAFRAGLVNGRHHVEQDLYGHKVLLS